MTDQEGRIAPTSRPRGRGRECRCGWIEVRGIEPFFPSTFLIQTNLIISAVLALLEIRKEAVACLRIEFAPVPLRQPFAVRALFWDPALFHALDGAAEGAAAHAFTVVGPVVVAAVIDLRCYGRASKCEHGFFLL